MHQTGSSLHLVYWTARYHIYQGMRSCMWTITRGWKLEPYNHFIWRQFLRAYYPVKARCILSLLSICNPYLEKLSIKNLETISSLSHESFMLQIQIPQWQLWGKKPSMCYETWDRNCEQMGNTTETENEGCGRQENTGWWHTITPLLPLLGGLIPGGIFIQTNS